MTDSWVRPKILATELGVAESTLAAWAKEGAGPHRYRLGPRVRAYKRSEIDAWIKSLEAAGSRSDERPTQRGVA